MKTEEELRQLIGMLADLSDEDYKKVEKDVWKIRLAKKQEVARAAERGEFAVLEESLLAAGVKVVGLQRGHDHKRGIKPLRALWPKGRVPHLLALYGRGIYSMCGGHPRLEDLTKVSTSSTRICTRCQDAKHRDGFFRGCSRLNEALAARSCES